MHINFFKKIAGECLPTRRRRFAAYFAKQEEIKFGGARTFINIQGFLRSGLLQSCRQSGIVK